MKGVLHNPETLQRITGVTEEEFRRVLANFNAIWREVHYERTVHGRQRLSERRPGVRGGIKDTATMLLFVLFYYRWYPSQKAIGILFGMTQQWASILLQRLTPIVSEALGVRLAPPRRKPLGLEALLRLEPAVRTLVDREEMATLPSARKADRSRATITLW